MIDASLQKLLDAVRTGAVGFVIENDAQRLFPKRVHGLQATTVWYDDGCVRDIRSSPNKNRYPYCALFFVDEKGITTTPVRMNPAEGYTNPVLQTFSKQVEEYRASLKP